MIADTNFKACKEGREKNSKRSNHEKLTDAACAADAVMPLSSVYDMLFLDTPGL